MNKTIRAALALAVLASTAFGVPAQTGVTGGNQPFE